MAHEVYVPGILQEDWYCVIPDMKFQLLETRLELTALVLLVVTISNGRFLAGIPHEIHLKTRFLCRQGHRYSTILS